MRKKAYSAGQAVEVKVLKDWVPAYIESDEGGGWYVCNTGFRSDLFETSHIREAKS